MIIEFPPNQNEAKCRHPSNYQDALMKKIQDDLVKYCEERGYRQAVKEVSVILADYLTVDQILAALEIWCGRYGMTTEKKT